MDFQEAIKLLRYKYPKGTIQIDAGVTVHEDPREQESTASASIRLFAYGICEKGEDLETIVRVKLLGQHD